MERFATKSDQYEGLARKAQSLLEDEQDPIANAANMAALLFEMLPGVNWAGFYFRRGDQLVLGPFQGRIACVRIPVGRGVCGTSVSLDKSLLVANVHQFDGHIACDAASNAELVVPLRWRGRVVGVIDIDSPHIGRFDETDQQGVEELAEIFVRSSRLDDLGLVED